jgi:hypothetical protein
MEQFSLGIGSRVIHPEFGTGVIIQVRPDTFSIVFIQHGQREIARNYDQFDVIDPFDQDNDVVSLADIEQILADLLRRFSDVQERVDIGPKWTGGMIVLKPGDISLKSKEVPIDVFFNKIVMLRDRLRVLEQKINAHKGLTETDKVDMQQYITRCYGSLTTFNVLFKHNADHFVGEKGSKE